ncbi:MAG: hypothetical protein RL701_690 [Pseudomonadota bacterium]
MAANALLAPLARQVTYRAPRCPRGPPSRFPESRAPPVRVRQLVRVEVPRARSRTTPQRRAPAGQSGPMALPDAGSASRIGVPAGSGASGSGAAVGGSRSDGSGASGGSASGGGAAGESSFPEPMMPAPSGPCAGHAGETVCEGAVLQRCGATGSPDMPETCMSAAFCQIGVQAGACAVCTPGTFRCEGTRLDKCTAEGQYLKSDDCDSAALCKADAGKCTDMACVPNAATCSPDGSSLRTCNADGSAFANESPCNGKGCNQASATCNKCMPGQPVCSGNGVVTCSADGQTMSSKTCVAAGECATSTCLAGACVPGSKPAGGECLTGMCNGRGACVEKPCGNGRLDAGEQCDFGDSSWRGTCDSNCKVTAAAYKQCAWNAGECPGDWFCTSVGMCGRLCSQTADCPMGSDCRPVTDNNKACVWNCGGLGNQGCPSSARCVWYGKEGVVNLPAYQTCGWISADPTNGNAPWCQYEYATCCGPSGSPCFTHP